MNKDQVLKLADFLEKVADEAVDPQTTDIDRVAEGVAAIAGAQAVEKTGAFDMGTAPHPSAPMTASRTFKPQKSPVTTPLSAAKAAPAQTRVAPQPPPPGEKTAEEKEALLRQGLEIGEELWKATKGLGRSATKATQAHQAAGRISRIPTASAQRAHAATKAVRGEHLKELGKGMILPGAVAAGGYGAGKVVLGSDRQVGLGHLVAHEEAL